MPELRPGLQYATLEQQADTAQLGMWTFIATEILFFGAVLFAYAVYRAHYSEEFRHAARDSQILLGAINQVLLVTSSLTMVMAIEAARDDRQKALRLLLLATAFLGICFLGVKGYEYYLDYDAHTVPTVNFVFKPGLGRASELFWIFYFFLTGLHAVHLTIGIVLVLIMHRKARRYGFSPSYFAPLEVVGLYWSFVDTVWFFLFAAIYPIGRAGS